MNRPIHPILYVVCCLATAIGGCYGMRSSSGGGQTAWSPPRVVDAAGIALPDGYMIEPVSVGLTFPTAVAFDESGGVYVLEAGYSYGEVWTEPRLLRVGSDGSTSVVARGDTNGPWTAVAYHGGSFYVSEGGTLTGGRILRIDRTGRTTPLVSRLPSLGDHHTNAATVGPDGYIYFGQGTATNSSVVGPDNADFGWLARHPEFHDIPCADITLAGVNYESDNPLTSDPDDRVSTGSYAPFGTATTPGQTIRGSLPCSGAIMRVPVAGGPLELVAWGFRNPFGMAFSPDGNLYVTENGYDERGSRPVWGAGDVLWRITPGSWYGWPDYSAGDSVDDIHYRPPNGDRVARVLQRQPGVPPRPVAILGVHSSSNGFDFSRAPSFGYLNHAFVAQFGDEAPTVGKVLHPVGFKVVRVDVVNGIVEDFATNINSEGNGPASWIGSGGLERPVAAKFDPTGESLYIVDFGVMLQDKEGAMPQQKTGVLWRIRRSR